MRWAQSPQPPVVLLFGCLIESEIFVKKRCSARQYSGEDYFFIIRYINGGEQRLITFGPLGFNEPNCLFAFFR